MHLPQIARRLVKHKLPPFPDVPGEPFVRTALAERAPPSLIGGNAGFRPYGSMGTGRRGWHHPGSYWIVPVREGLERSASDATLDVGRGNVIVEIDATAVL